MEIREKKYDMCKAFVDMRLEGMQVHLIQAVCKKLQKSKSPAVIAEELEEELPEIEKIINAQQQAGNYDVEQIYSILTSRNEIWISS